MGTLGDAIDKRSAIGHRKIFFFMKIEIEIGNSFFDLIVKMKSEKKENRMSLSNHRLFSYFFVFFGFCFCVCFFGARDYRKKTFLENSPDGL